MESILKSDWKALKALILYETLKNKTKSIDEQKSIWQVFQSFSKILGDDFMNFPDFEHFYLKLEKGECDLDYDGRLKYNRNLCELPLDIIRLIVAKLADREKWIFRESVPFLRKIIDPYLPGCNELFIRHFGKEGIVSFTCGSSVEIKYFEKRSEESGKLEVHRSFMGYPVENNEGRTMDELMIRDIRQMLENPKNGLIKLNIFSSELRWDSNLLFFEKLKPILKSQEGVRNLMIRTSSSSRFLPILSGLKPNTLETIELTSRDERKMDLSEILEMDQMKEAKRVTLHCLNASYPLESVLHSEDFVGTRYSLEPEDALMIKNESTRTGKVKMFRLQTDQRMPLPQINKLLGPLDPEFNDTAERRHFRIQNSVEFMRMTISECRIDFVQVPRFRY